MAAGSGMGRGGFLLSANLDRFIALIQEHVSLMLGLEPNKVCRFLASCFSPEGFCYGRCNTGVNQKLCAGMELRSAQPFRSGM